MSTVVWQAVRPYARIGYIEKDLAKLDAKVDKLDAKFGTRIDVLETKLETRLTTEIRALRVNLRRDLGVVRTRQDRLQFLLANGVCLMVGYGVSHALLRKPPADAPGS